MSDLQGTESPTSEGQNAELVHVDECRHGEDVVTRGPRKVSQILMMLWSGLALASDGYNSQSMGSANSMLALLYPKTATYEGYEKDMKGRVSSSYYVGLCLGAVFFGFLIDRYSRKTGVVLATCLMIVGGALATASWASTPHNMFWMLTVTRGILGFGAGGEYPTCSTGATEAGDESPFVRKYRGMLVALVGCTAIDVGIVFGGVLPLIILSGYGYNANTDPDRTEGLAGAWRVSLGLGLIIPLSVFFFRIKMVTSTSFQNHSLRQNFSLKIWWIVFKTYWRQIVGTTMCWFLYDFINYPFTLFSSHIALGFALQAVIGFVLGGAVSKISKITPLYIVLYGLLLASGEGGPGIATLLLSAESYPTAVRGHLAGLSAAVAKAGAAIGTTVFDAISSKYSGPGQEMQSLRVPVLVAASISVVGCILTLFCFPAKHSQHLEEEDLRFRQILKDHGISDDVWGDTNSFQSSTLDEDSDKLEKDYSREHIDFIFRLLNEQGQGDYLGEAISQLEHCKQAAYFAQQEQKDEQIVIAALLHDIGQFLPWEELQSGMERAQLMDKDLANVGRQGHDTLGQMWLEQHGWPQRVCDLVGAHVNAKRYLTATRPEYYASLSEASKASLRMQGGPFDEEELRKFESNPSYREMVALRLYDDKAKQVNLETPPLESYRPMATRVLRGEST
ncbi:hypothetical protein MCAP1_000369 [Malassezia caprae]|uniref:HD domain-containing protein n=1 Tax=Malassezia caprae TaxID=1381934 RepID=A0AAF0E4S0_9BASI|nr:hypothetical protein MCAP1_000369 [Malassezia caprae]